MQNVCSNCGNFWNDKRRQRCDVEVEEEKRHNSMDSNDTDGGNAILLAMTWVLS